MKIYRCIIGGLLVLFLVIGVWYIASCVNEQRSIQDGTLIYQTEAIEIDRKENGQRGEYSIGTGNGLC